MLRASRHFVPALIALLASGLFSACAATGPGRSASGDTASAGSPDAPASTETKVAALEAEVARLRIERDRATQTNTVLEDELRWAHEDLRIIERQFTEFEHRLTEDYGKAAAVSATAEARINLSRSVTALPDSTNQRVTAMLVTAEKLIRENNYPAALFFAGRANHTIKSEERRATLDEGSRPMVVAVSAANLRRGPGQNYETMETLPEGTQVVCMDVARNWCHVRTTGGDSGWIHASLLR